MNCKPKTFLGVEGEVGLTYWIEKMESIFEISLCAGNCKVKFDVCTFKDTTLSSWNNHVKTMGFRTANAISWDELKHLIMDE